MKHEMSKNYKDDHGCYVRDLEDGIWTISGEINSSFEKSLQEFRKTHSNLVITATFLRDSRSNQILTVSTEERDRRFLGVIPWR